MMKNLILLSIVLLLSVCTLAQNTQRYKPDDVLTIEEIFDKDYKSIKGISICIDNKEKTIGSTFKGKQKIKWPSNIYSITVINGRTGERISISSTDYKPAFKGIIDCFYQLLIIKKSLSTKGVGNDENVKTMKEKLAQTFYMLNDYLIISSSLKLDNKHTYMLEAVNNSDLRFNLYYSEEEPYYIIITKDMLKENNIDIEKGHCTFRVSYIGDGECSQITDKFTIEEYKENNSK